MERGVSRLVRHLSSPHNDFWDSLLRAKLHLSIYEAWTPSALPISALVRVALVIVGHC